MTLTKKVRAVGGFLSIITLLAMLFLDFWVEAVAITDMSTGVLLTVIMGLLGVDMALDRLPLTVQVGRTPDAESEDADRGERQ